MISMVSLLTLRSFKPETSGPPTSFYFPYDNALKINRIPAIKELPTIDTVLPSSTMLYALSFSAISCIFCIFIFLASSHQHSTSFFCYLLTLFFFDSSSFRVYFLFYHEHMLYAWCMIWFICRKFESVPSAFSLAIVQWSCRRVRELQQSEFMLEKYRDTIKPV